MPWRDGFHMLVLSFSKEGTRVSAKTLAQMSKSSPSCKVRMWAKKSLQRALRLRNRRVPGDEDAACVGAGAGVQRAA